MMCPSIIQYLLLIIGYLSIASGLVVKVVKDLGKGSKNKMEIFNGTRSYAALWAADLDWIVGSGYSSGGYNLKKNHEKP